MPEEEEAPGGGVVGGEKKKSLSTHQEEEEEEDFKAGDLGASDNNPSSDPWSVGNRASATFTLKSFNRIIAIAVVAKSSPG